MSTARSAGLLLLIVSVAIVSCSGGKEKEEDIFASSHPDSVLVRMERAWEGRDLAMYGSRVLYDGATPDAEGKTHGAFVFYHKGANQVAEPLYGYDQEMKVTEAMFAGKVKEQRTPPIRSIDLDIERRGDWKALPAGEMALDDPCPSGTQSCLFNGMLRLTFEDALPGTDDNHYQVQHHGTLYVIPVQITDRSEDPVVEYRIWKWVDEGRTETTPVEEL